MSLKSAILSRVLQRFLSTERLMKQRDRHERKRLKSGEPERIHYFHQSDDPYSHLTAQILPQLAKSFSAEIVPHIVAPPQDSVAPERERLIAYSRVDAQRLAQRAGLNFFDSGSQPPADAIAEADAALVGLMKKSTRDFIDQAHKVSEKLWSGSSLASFDKATSAEVERAKQEGDNLRAELGHYLGATFYYAGEWYWGIDRLHYLETRIMQQALGAQIPAVPGKHIYSPPQELASVPPKRNQPAGKGTVPALAFYLSFRSPYTYISVERAKRIADAYGAELRLRYVLPMVMRDLPVPRIKGMYIMRDTAREANRLGISFGRIADPVGTPVRRGYSLLPMAIEQGQGYEFVLSFLRAVWAEGVDAGSDKGMRKIVERAGLDWAEAQKQLREPNWQAEEEVNQQDLLKQGVWGVPSFQVGDQTVWGQDRLWVAEQWLQEATAESATK